MSRLLSDDSMTAGRWIVDELRHHQPPDIGSKQVNFRFWLKAVGMGAKTYARCIAQQSNLG